MDVVGRVELVGDGQDGGVGREGLVGGRAEASVSV